jgi:hypothetical protein
MTNDEAAVQSTNTLESFEHETAAPPVFRADELLHRFARFSLFLVAVV